MSETTTHDDDSLRDIDELWLDVLLRRAYDPDAEGREARVARVMAGIGGPSDGPGEAVRAPGRVRWATWLVAATLVMGVGLIWQAMAPTQRAHATVSRSLSVAKEAGPREYDIRTTFRLGPDDAREVVATLYVDGADRFALRHPAPFGHPDIWVGGDGEQVWIVPPHGPVLVGDGSMLAAWTGERDRWATPFLHITTILERLADDYVLASPGDVSLPDPGRPGLRSLCHHVRGERRVSRSDPLPDAIELWADVETGIARRVRLMWTPSKPAGDARMEIELRLAGRAEIPADWFEHAAHHDGRPVLQRPR